MLAQEVSPALLRETLDVLPSNRQHLIAIVSYQHFADRWDDIKPALLAQKSVVILT